MQFIEYIKLGFWRSVVVLGLVFVTIAALALEVIFISKTFHNAVLFWDAFVADPFAPSPAHTGWLEPFASSVFMLVAAGFTITLQCRIYSHVWQEWYPADEVAEEEADCAESLQSVALADGEGELVAANDDSIDLGEPPSFEPADEPSPVNKPKPAAAPAKKSATVHQLRQAPRADEWDVPVVFDAPPFADELPAAPEPAPAPRVRRVQADMPFRKQVNQRVPKIEEAPDFELPPVEAY